MFHDVFEQRVLSKPYFDAKGLIIAEQGDQVVGFVHCGFGPNSDGSDIDMSRGIICILLTAADADKQKVCCGLIEQAEAYLVSRGSRRITTGTDFPYSPFYLGLYGGSNVPGIVSDNEAVIPVFEKLGYSQLQKVLIMQRSLLNFRAVLDRQQTTVRRGYRIQHDQDPLPANWWEACTLGNTNRMLFRLIERKSGLVNGHISYWDMEPLARNWGIRAMGLFGISIEREARKLGLGTFLIGESLRHMQQQAINLVEAQVLEDNLPAVNLFEKMGFETIDTGRVLQKTIYG